MTTELARSKRSKHKKGNKGSRVALCREIARKLVESRLGSHKRALAKSEDIKAVNEEQRAKQAMALCANCTEEKKSLLSLLNSSLREPNRQRLPTNNFLQTRLF